MTNFRNLKIWQKGMDIVVDIYKLTKFLPHEEKIDLRSQMTRAAVSIPSNIAEGCSRSSQKDFKRFLEVSLGSAFELETQLLICQRLNFIEENSINIMLKTLHEEQKMINGYNGYINSVKSNI